LLRNASDKERRSVTISVAGLCLDHFSAVGSSWLAQERSETIEAQLAATTSQLHDLKLRQRQLEARNDLLEKVAALNKQQSFQATASVSPGAPSTRLNMWQV